MSKLFMDQFPTVYTIAHWWTYAGAEFCCKSIFVHKNTEAFGAYMYIPQICRMCNDVHVLLILSHKFLLLEKFTILLN